MCNTIWWLHDQDIIILMLVFQNQIETMTFKHMTTPLFEAEISKSQDPTIPQDSMNPF